MKRRSGLGIFRVNCSIGIGLRTGQQWTRSRMIVYLTSISVRKMMVSLFLLSLLSRARRESEIDADEGERVCRYRTSTSNGSRDLSTVGSSSDRTRSTRGTLVVPFSSLPFFRHPDTDFIRLMRTAPLRVDHEPPSRFHHESRRTTSISPLDETIQRTFRTTPLTSSVRASPFSSLSHSSSADMCECVGVQLLIDRELMSIQETQVYVL